MAATLIEANQNSNSPKDLTEIRLVSGQRQQQRQTDEPAGGSSGNQNRTRPAPATASSATTMTQKYQYIQPVKNPAKLADAAADRPGQARVFVERPDRRQRHRHLAQHAHHQHHQQAGDQEGDAPRPDPPT